jgi:hypothetical protein
MRHTRQPATDRKLPAPAPAVFQQQWFFEMIPSPINGEIRLRMHRPSSWVCVAEAADLIACGIQKVHHLCDDGQLEWRWLDHEGSGGKKLVLVDSVQHYLTKKHQLHPVHPSPRQLRNAKRVLRKRRRAL